MSRAPHLQLEYTCRSIAYWWLSEIPHKTSDNKSHFAGDIRLADSLETLSLISVFFDTFVSALLNAFNASITAALCRRTFNKKNRLGDARTDSWIHSIHLYVFHRHSCVMKQYSLHKPYHFLHGKFLRDSASFSSQLSDTGADDFGLGTFECHALWWLKCWLGHRLCFYIVTRNWSSMLKDSASAQRQNRWGACCKCFIAKCCHTLSDCRRISSWIANDATKYWTWRNTNECHRLKSFFERAIKGSRITTLRERLQPSVFAKYIGITLKKQHGSTLSTEEKTPRESWLKLANFSFEVASEAKILSTVRCVVQHIQPVTYIKVNTRIYYPIIWHAMLYSSTRLIPCCALRRSLKSTNCDLWE